MNHIDFNTQNIPLVFDRFRLRLKSQARIVSQTQSISRNKAYELISILWGYENWYQLNRFLKSMEEIHLSVRLMDYGLEDADARLLLWRLEAFKKHIDSFEGGWYNRKYVSGIYSAITSQPDKEYLCDLPGTEEYCYRFIDCWDDYIWLFDSLAHKTAWLQGRKIYCTEFLDLATSLFEYLSQYQGDVSQFNLATNEPELSWQLHHLIPSLFGISQPEISLEHYLENISDSDALLGCQSRTPISELLIGQSLEFEQHYQLTLKELCTQLAQADADALSIAWERFASIGGAASHLPDNALIEICMDRPDAPILIHTISVEKKDAAALLACISTNPITGYNVDDTTKILGGDSQLKERYIGGITAYWE